MGDGILGGGLESMAEGMSEVQDLAEPTFPLVPGYDIGLELHGAHDDLLEGVRISVQ